MTVTPPALEGLYYTHIPYRDPEGRLHLTIGGAKASFTTGWKGHLKAGELWQMVEGEWGHLFTVEGGTVGAPWN